MSRTVTVAATQMASSPEPAENARRAEALVRRAHREGAQVVLLQELFETPYFCIEQDERYFSLAHPSLDNPLVERFRKLAAELEVVLPVSFFERTNNAFFNSIAIVDADGSLAGTYRKSHIPDGFGYQEKFYFTPGDTGFRAFQTRYARIGVAICWDQWFPEAARAMALAGADMLLYPTAIGSEPNHADLDSRDHWQRTMQGHAAANMRPVIASNRIGRETVGRTSVTFYGSSFIADETGAKVAECGRAGEDVITHRFDLDRIAAKRAGWGIFRDRRPELYGALLGHDGRG
ncbi:MAG: N-carbamoylputrescine amidase [Hyphomicrobiaceae bacterium]